MNIKILIPSENDEKHRRNTAEMSTDNQVCCHKWLTVTKFILTSFPQETLQFSIRTNTNWLEINSPLTKSISLYTKSIQIMLKYSITYVIKHNNNQTLIESIKT